MVDFGVSTKCLDRSKFLITLKASVGVENQTVKSSILSTSLYTGHHMVHDDFFEHGQTIFVLTTDILSLHES